MSVCRRLTGCTLSVALLLAVWHCTNAYESSKCERCKTLVKGFREQEKKTARDNYGGGDVHWEEKSRSPYSKSETRLVEILENACETTNHGCTSMQEDTEELIETWWFKKQEKYPNLQDWLCRMRLQVCCRKNRFGKNCTECPGGIENPCSGGGTCEGAGDKEGSGKCHCNYGHTGDKCETCQPEFFFDEQMKECLNCHRACVENCTGPYPEHCEACDPGWELMEGGGCKDTNECVAGVKPEVAGDDEDEDEAGGSTQACSPEQYCENTEGSFNCHLCDASCFGCTGAGKKSCTSCSMGYQMNETTKRCEDVDECVRGVVVSKDSEEDDVIGESLETVDGVERRPACNDETEKCENSVGTYTCLCKAGYSRREGECRPIPAGTADSGAADASSDYTAEADGDEPVEDIAAGPSPDEPTDEDQSLEPQVADGAATSKEEL